MASTIDFYYRNDLFVPPVIRNFRIPDYNSWASYIIISLIIINEHIEEILNLP